MMRARFLFRNKALRFVLCAVVLYVFWFFWKSLDADAAYYQGVFSRYRAWAGLLFILLYVGTTTLVWFGPKDILRVSAAIAFGALSSTALVWVAEMINACIMFHLSRALGRDYVAKRFRAGTQSLDRLKDDPSLLGVMALRINPLVPFRFIDLGYGLTQITFLKYLAGISVVSVVRIYWLQFILAEPGLNLIAEISAAARTMKAASGAGPARAAEVTTAAMDRIAGYITNNPEFLYYSGLYFLAVIVMAAAASIVRFLKKKEKSGLN